MVEPVKLDQIDLKILSILHGHARVTNQELSERVGLSPSPCLQRVRKLEGAGLMGPYLARLDLDRICRNVVVIATVTLRTHEHQDFKAFEAAVAALPEVVECFKVSGSFDYFLRFVCPDLARYHRWGPLRARPGFQFSNVGYDTNIFADTVNPVGDYTATLSPKLAALAAFTEKRPSRSDHLRGTDYSPRCVSRCPRIDR